MTDERARVPLALVGVALLVASAGVAGHISLGRPTAATPASDRAARDATALARLAVENGTARAARAAARNPVVTPRGAYGRALRPDHAFRDALRLRVYLAARRALRNATATTGGVTARVSLPRIDSPGRARRAIGCVTLAERPGGGLNATVSNLTLTLSRDDRPVDRDSMTISVAVDTPVLALHRRVAAYGRELGNGPLDGPGLGRRLTARLTVVAWGRGWAQYGGAPIANVVATRHVAVTTNAAVLGVQRATLGRTDPRAVSRYHEKSVETGVQDLLAGASNAASPGSPGLSTDAGARTLATAQNVSDRLDGAHTVRVGVNATADRAYLNTSRSLDRVLRRTYHGEIRVVTAVRRVATRRVNTTTGVARVTAASSGPTPGVPNGFDGLSVDYRRVVVASHAGNASVATTYRVGVALAGRATPTGDAPDRPLATEPTRALEDAARAVLVQRGGVDAVAHRAVRGTSEGPSSVTLPVPPRARKRAARSLARLRERLARNVSVEVSSAGALHGRPRQRLAETVSTRESTLVGAPERYHSLADRGVAAARTAYLDAVESDLRGHTGGFTAARSAVADGSPMPLAAANSRPSQPANASGLVTAVAGTPAYLSTSRICGTYPLAARNVNLFTLPYGDAGSAVANAVFPAKRQQVPLSAAVATLRATRGVDGNASVRRTRRRLRAEVQAATHRIRTSLSASLARETQLSPSARESAVASAFASYPDAAARARGAVNGSLADRLAGAAETRGADGGPRGGGADRLNVALRVALRRARRRQGRVAGGPVSDARSVGHAAIAAAAKTGAHRVGDAARTAYLREDLAELPSGLPVAPVPGYWYATANAWVVSVRGGYRRFTVTARSGTPGDDSLSDVRRNETVTIDVDGDGQQEVVGRNRELRFSVTTLVVVVVPPGPRGVGDTGGGSDERSAGW